MKVLFSLFVFLLIPTEIICCPAFPYKVCVQCDGDLADVFLFGDEHCKWAETMDGYTVIQDNDNQWRYAVVDEINGFLIPSTISLVQKNRNEEDYMRFLAETPKHLRPQSLPHHYRGRKIGKAIGERRILVILMEFADLGFSKTQQDFEQLFNQTNYHEDGAQGSVKDYYMSASYGQLSLTCDVYGPYTAIHPMSYYGNNGLSGGDVNPFSLFEEAIGYVCNDADLKAYDGDGDGYVDNVHIIYAGYGEEAGGPASAIWAHEMTFGREYIVNNMKIDKYSCAPELRGNSGKGITRIGPHCHEIGHALGAMDYYDTDYKIDGEFLGTGVWDVMAQGSWNNNGVTPADFNPYVKSTNFGWITPHALPAGETIIEPSSASPNNYYILRSDDSNDYYLIENRTKDGYGAALPGEGLLFFHIDGSIHQAGNKINATAPQLCYPVCASSKSKRPSDSAKSYGDINTGGCPFPGTSNNTLFGPSSTPEAFFWDTKQCGIKISGIQWVGNKNIMLFNASDGVDKEPIETQILYSESFENSPEISLVEKHNGTWSIVANPTGTGLATRPFAHNGDMSLQLSAKQNLFDNAVSSFDIYCPAHDADKEVFATVYFTSSGITGKKRNTLRIGFMDNHDDNWHYAEISSTVNNTWNPFTILIPGSFSSIIRIEGMALPGTILAIDDIIIEQNLNSESNLAITAPKLFNNKVFSEEVYSLFGMPSRIIFEGLNIIRMPDGSFRKVFITK